MSHVYILKFGGLDTQFGGKPPNLMTANISGYTVYVVGVTHGRIYVKWLTKWTG